ncbi:MAG TPA: hypothetical protein IAA26_03145 [Candidatus Blautia faecipullorum]|nr:hypothetical protein [Candidatus Blautia faecipullorum]
MNIDQYGPEISALKNTVAELERKVQYLEMLLDNENHDLFEEWFKRFLDDKCNGGW